MSTACPLCVPLLLRGVSVYLVLSTRALCCSRYQHHRITLNPLYGEATLLRWVSASQGHPSVQSHIGGTNPQGRMGSASNGCPPPAEWVFA